MLKIVCIAIILTAGTALSADTIPDKVRLQNQNVVKKAAEGMNENLPQKVDPYTSLVKIEPKGERLIYIYELDVKGKSDDQLTKEGKVRMKAPVIRGICTSSRRFLDSGIDITYIYTSAKSKKKLFQFDVSKKDCHENFAEK
ncbi:MAG: hypothetical protein DSZ05_04835 [Sulfurospirillum sp.]|nr:MAG: hypothetical protein DSZ05_04835 [Sulfurospirillum sp.]